MNQVRAHLFFFFFFCFLSYHAFVRGEDKKKHNRGVGVHRKTVFVVSGLQVFGVSRAA